MKMDMSILRKLQLVELEILDEVVSICEKNNLDYFLMEGTLLGAIRHKGFIPWDDDIDIAMPREHYEKFLKLAKTQLNSNYFVHCIDTDPSYWLPFAKVRKNGTIVEEEIMTSIDTHKGIYIDIFPLDNANKQESMIQKLQAYVTKKLMAVIWLKRGLLTKKINLKHKIVLTLLKPVRLKYLSLLQQKIMSINKNKDSKYFVNLGSCYNYLKHTIPKNRYYPPVKVEFEGKYYNAPNDWDYILRRIYGENYLELPPEEKRTNHNFVHIDFGEDKVEQNTTK